MDPLQLVQTTLVFLSPYLQKGFEGLAGKLGEKAADFLSKLKDLVGQDQASSEVLAKFKEDPELYVKSLEIMLKRKVAEPEFARRLSELIAETPATSDITVQATGGNLAMGVEEAEQSSGSLKVKVTTEGTDETIGVKRLRQGKG